MAPTRCLRVKLTSKVFIKLSFFWKRKPKSPSHSPTATISDHPSIQDVDETWNVAEKECTYVVDFDPTVWQEILAYCEVVDIIHVGMTCRSLALMTESHWVWYSALLRICHDRRLPHLCFHMKSLSVSALRQKAISLVRLDRLRGGLPFIAFPHGSTRLSLPASTVWEMSFLPGGEWLAVLCGDGNEDGVTFCKANDPSGQRSYSFVPGKPNDMCIFTSDQGDLLMILSTRPGCHIGVYLICLLEGHPPRLEKVWSITMRSSFENLAAERNYIVFGWISRSDVEPRHFIRVLKFESCRREFTEYSTMQVEWDVARYYHSYALRIVDSQVIVVVSSRSLVAAYKVLPVTSARSNPTVATPFWRFPCSHMKPSAVHLVLSLPAVHTPGVAIFYRDRCLFIAPSFESDPPGVHPTYFSTSKYPREIKRPMILGPQRAFWDLGCGRVGIGLLPTPLEPVFCEQGSCDTTGVNVPETNLVDFVYPLVYAEPHYRRVARAAWDEESGRLALFPRTEFQQAQDISIFIVDFA